MTERPSWVPASAHAWGEGPCGVWFDEAADFRHAEIITGARCRHARAQRFGSWLGRRLRLASLVFGEVRDLADALAKVDALADLDAPPPAGRWLAAAGVDAVPFVGLSA